MTDRKPRRERIRIVRFWTKKELDEARAEAEKLADYFALNEAQQTTEQAK